MFSPDGRWLAYASNESGRPEVYVRPFPGPGGKWQISTGGGNLPTWSRTKQRAVLRPQRTDHGRCLHGGRGRVPRRKAAALVRGAVPDARTEPHVRPAPRRRAVRARARRERTPARSTDKVVFIFNFFDELRRIAPTSTR